MSVQTFGRRPALRYHGGKWRLAPWIISHFPPHRVYVEPFGGAASVLLQKPRSKVEIYNELNGDVVNLFMVLRDRRQSRELERLIRLTPFARQEFKAAYQETADPIEKARRLIVRSFMGFSSAAHNPKHFTGFRVGNGRDGAATATDWKNYPDALDFLRERMQGVGVENVPAMDLIRKRDGADYLFYLDPPYAHASRGARQSANYGEFEMTDRQHLELAEELHRVKGMVVLSGYESGLYRELYGDWQQVKKQTFGNGHAGAEPRTEVLWLNDHCARCLK